MVANSACTMGSSQVDIVFSAGKGEPSIPDKGLRTLANKLRQTWSVETSPDVFESNMLSRSKMVIFAGVTEKFFTAELAILQRFVSVQKGFVVFLVGAETRPEMTANLNVFLEEYGMSINSEAVIKRSFNPKYLIPKEALITDAYLQKMTINNDKASAEQEAILFPFGATLKVGKPAIPLLTTGANCLPAHKAICALYSTPTSGRILLLTSAHVFHDNFIEKEQNLTLVERLFGLVFAENLPRVLPDEGDLQEWQPYLDIAELANRVAPVADISFELPSDLRKVYDSSFDISDLAKIGKVVLAYRQLGLAREPLSLVAPNFQGLYPNLQLAIYPPPFADAPLPPLDFFDFNAEFLSEREKLNQIFSDMADQKELKQYISTVFSALAMEIPSGWSARSPKDMLELITRNIMALKSESWLQ
ncbi:hypothetical protein RvY_14015 [Ramazzottius varieornatus]|uniref:Uncharacterized protein n=1 Tax=Ramazzottius varieornatus TaxID=947166 RepID=A0A1D1VYD3_RAMVA|nr:hypothetical protein RvY_14015 [Ramazzottius varieornatus]